MNNEICRCRICNAVSNSSIATMPGDFTSTRFYEDGLGHLCFYCHKEIGESLTEFEDDETEAWDESEEMD